MSDIILVAKFSCLQGQVAGMAVNKKYHRPVYFLTVQMIIETVDYP